MGLFDFFRKKKDFTYTSTGLLVGQFGSDIESLVDAAIKNPYINRALNLRAQAVADLSWEIVSNDKPNEKLMSWFSQPLNLTSRQFIQKIQLWRDIAGVAFVRKSFPQPELLDGDRVSLLVTPSEIKIIYTRMFQVDTYDISEVALITGQSPFVRVIKDISPLYSVFEDAKLQYRQVEVLSNIFKNGAFLNMIFTTQDELTPEELDNIREQIKEKYTAPANAGKVMLLSGSDWNVVDIKNSPLQFGIKEVDDLIKQRIMIVFGIPSVFFNDMQGVNRAVAQTQEYIFEKYVIKPLANDLAEQITSKILDSKAEFRFKYEENLSLEDMQMLWDIRKTQLEVGYTYVNELRQQDGKEPLPWGNDFWGNLSMTSLGSVSFSAEKILEKLERIEKRLEERDLDFDMISKDYIALTEPMEKRLAKEVMSIFEKQEKYILSQLEKRKGIVQKIELSDVVDITLPDDWVDYIVKHLKPFILSFMQQAGDKTIALLGFSASFNLQVPSIQEYLMKSLEKSASEIIRTTRKDVYDQLLEGVKNGESIPQLADRMRTLFEETYKNRSKTIARTEVISATNYAKIESAKQVGMRKKVWVTAIDERTRTGHAEANAQVRDIDEPFEVAIEAGEEKEPLMYPGDKSGSPGNIINCRCTVAFRRD
jgi:HK97 family phage portal protein